MTEEEEIGKVAMPGILAGIEKAHDQIIMPLVKNVNSMSHDERQELREKVADAMVQLFTVSKRIVIRETNNAALVVKIRKLMAAGGDSVTQIAIAKASDRMATRVAELRKSDPKLAKSSDDVVIAKVAESRAPGDAALWRDYRAEKARKPMPPQKDTQFVVSDYKPPDDLNVATEKPIDATKPRTPPTTPEVGRPPSDEPALPAGNKSPMAARFEALVDAHQKANPGKHRGHSVAAVMATPDGMSLYRHMRSEHLIGMTKMWEP